MGTSIGRGGTARFMSAEAIPRPIVVLVCAVVAGQAAAVFLAPVRGPIVAVTLLLLDVLGAFFSLRAARISAFPDSWRLAALGRLSSGVALLAVTACYHTGSSSWWVTGVVAQLAMFAALATAGLVMPLRQLRGSRRKAHVAEIVTVLGGGFMLVWYFTIHPALEGAPVGVDWLVVIGFPVGDLLLIVAVATLPLTGALVRVCSPLTTYAVGLAMYAVTHATWPLTDPRLAPAGLSVPASLAMVTACLLLTLAPMMVSYGWTASAGEVRPARPGWLSLMSQVPIVLGCALLLGVIMSGDGYPPWTGLLGGLIVLTGGMGARQLLAFREREDQLRTDPLTGLLNRAGLERTGMKAVTRTGRAALMVLNLDGFRTVNEAHGHRSGDAVLAAFADCLQSGVQRQDLVARLGGDEFGVLLTGVDTEGDLVASANRILAAAAAHRVRLTEASYCMRASAGLVLGEPGDSLTDLLRHAETALHHAKQSGTQTAVVYRPGMVDQRTREAALSEALDSALQLGQFEVAYQPLVRLTNNHLMGAEALLRWQHPTLGRISPAEFIPVAERSGAILSIGLWVLEQACRQLRDWQQRLPMGQSLYVSVNLSPRQLRTASLVQDVFSVLSRTGLDPQHLVLEVTESIIVDQNEDLAKLETLRAHGVRIAIDDFGTGYSSLHQLTRLPADILKIDRSFVAELDGTERGAAVAEAILRLSHVLRLTTIAEGVETAEQSSELHLLGCDIAQGYLLGAPGAPAAITAMINSPEPSSP